MNKKEFHIIITNDKNGISGCLHGAHFGRSIFEVAFDPLTVLCDLLNTVDYEDQSPYVQENYHFKADYRNHPFFRDEEYQAAIDKGFPRPHGFTLFYNAVDELKVIFENNQNASLNRFEVYKQFYGLEFTNVIEFQRINPMYNKHEFCKKHNWLKNDPDSEYQYETLSYDKKSDNSHTMKAVLEDADNQDVPKRFTYVCHSLEDIIFSVWHYLILLRYKFNRCNHCGNHFATKTLKQKYCKRNSPYEAYQHLGCEQAVRNIAQKLKRRKNAIERHYREDIKFQLQFDPVEFDVLCKKYSDASKRYSSVKNLKVYENYLYSPQFEKVKDTKSENKKS